MHMMLSKSKGRDNDEIYLWSDSQQGLQSICRW